MEQTTRLTDCIAPAFYDVWGDIKQRKHKDYIFNGGRGSTKSTFPSIVIPTGFLKDPLANAVAVMKLDVSVKNGVYTQLLWGIDKLGLSHEYRENKTEHTITNIRTGQTIFCKGCDDPKKFKSMTLRRGYFKYVWFEEIDAFDGWEEIRMVQQSLTRKGVDDPVRFYSYNPPAAYGHWLNKYTTDLQARINSGADTKTLLHHSDYRSVPKEWLGQAFIDDAEDLKSWNPDAYRHEYLGEIIGTGGQIFSNVTDLRITDDMIGTFGNIHRGFDWGYEDPSVYVEFNYNKREKSLYIYREVYEHGMGFDMLEQRLRAVGCGKLPVYADSEDKRANVEMQKRGWTFIPVRKGPGSVEAGITWLKDLKHIYIDSRRCPKTYGEFVGYERERNRAGEFKADYPDKNNHAIDATRYGAEPLMIFG